MTIVFTSYRACMHFSARRLLPRLFPPSRSMHLRAISISSVTLYRYYISLPQRDRVDADRHVVKLPRREKGPRSSLRFAGFARNIVARLRDRSQRKRLDAAFAVACRITRCLPISPGIDGRYYVTFNSPRDIQRLASTREERQQ